MSYVVKLENLNFDGPLDLLLQLINKAKIDIKDIFISNITDQYITHLRLMKEMDMYLTSDFLDMAALLLEIKSRALLPVVKDAEEGETPEELLIRRLEEYKACKELAGKLDTMHKENEGMVFRFPVELTSPRRVDIDFSFDALMEAFDAVLKKAKLKEERNEINTNIKRDRYTVNDAMHKIQNIIRRKSKAKFSELFESNDKEEIIAMFIALLELWKMNKVSIKQQDTYGEIYLENKA